LNQLDNNENKKRAFTGAMAMEWFEGFLIQRFGFVPASFTAQTSFADLGLDSMDAVVMAGLLEDALAMPLEPEIFLTQTCVADVIDLLNQRGILKQSEGELG
jgi:acyl carrier protein